MPAPLWILDRIEDGAIAILLSNDGGERQVPLSYLPSGIREGAALREKPGPSDGVPHHQEGPPDRDGPHHREGPRYILDQEETERLQDEARKLRDSLPRGPSGPLSL